MIRHIALLASAALAGAAPAAAEAPSLEGRAVLPADTFAEGPRSGAAVTNPTNGRHTPFASQPVQGFSAVLDAGGGAYWAMPDNGYGSKANSRDFLLRMYRIRPEFKTASGGSGEVTVEGFIQLSDPDERVPFALEDTDRKLTGADFDIESVRRDASGDLWFGDEFGPFLLHTDSTGKLLEAPISLPGVRSADNPYLGPGEASELRSSGGFEGMGLSSDGPCGTAGSAEILHPTLEKALEVDRLAGAPAARRRYIYSFSLATGGYFAEPYQYRTESSGHYIGDVTNVDEHRLLVTERDASQGATAVFKRIYLVDLRETDATGYLVKTELVDLMSVADPALISLPERPGDIGLGDPFSFPFETIEAVLPLDRERLLVLNDNNYPFSKGRNPDRIDDNEAIVIGIDALCDPPPEPPPPPDAAPGEDPPPAEAPPPGKGPGEVSVDRTGPTVRIFRVAPKRLRIGRRRSVESARLRVARRIAFRFTLTERGSVRVQIKRVLLTRRGRRLRRVGQLRRRRRTRGGAIGFTGRLSGRVLSPGLYRATLRATDAAGNRGRPRTVAFRVVR